MTEKADVRELATACWRLEKWLNNLNADRKMAAKSALRSIKKYIQALGVEIKDPIGSRFDPGLAIEVINNEAENTPEEELIIIETIAPYLYQDGTLIQHARVIIGSQIKVDRPNSAVSSESNDPVPGLQDGVTDQIQQLSTKTQHQDNSGEQPVTITQDDMERMLNYAKIL